MTADREPAGRGTPRPTIRAAETVLPCVDLDEELAFFVDRLGFRIEAVFPADAPTTAVVSGFGLRLRLRAGGPEPAAPVRLRLSLDDPESPEGGAGELVSPGGTRIELSRADPPLELPPLSPSLVVTKAGGEDAWSAGRAGMLYRDLIPERQGGRVIASHIRIPDGGPVPDYTHFHKIRFQMIYCRRGWVRVVYEDQGPPFVMEAGDAVLQPPLIRHRVLECSPGLEVVEITSPARHETLADHELELPAAKVDRDRTFGGQRFVRHRMAHATWRPWRSDGFECRQLGFGVATSSLAEAHVARVTTAPAAASLRHSGEMLFLFVLAGAVTLHAPGGGPWSLAAADAATIPPELSAELEAGSPDLELLEVVLG